MQKVTFYQKLVKFGRYKRSYKSIRDIGNGLGVKNMSDLVLKEIYGICETKYPTKEQVNEYKMSKREFYKKIYKVNMN